MISFLARVLAIGLVWSRWKATSGRPPLPPRSAPHRGEAASGEHASAESVLSSGPPERVESPLELEAEDWKETARRTVKEIKEDRIPFAAAGMAYYFFLAIFPSLIALVGILNLVDIDASSLIQSLRSSLPGGAGLALTRALANANKPSETASLLAAILGIAVALWSGSSGMVALQSGLNVAYDVREDRKLIGKRAVALLLLLVTLLLGGVPSPFFTFGESPFFVAIGWVLTVAAVVLLFSIFYYVGPNRRRSSWRWVSAGGLAGATIWILVSLAFGLYVAEFNSYGKTYGPLGGVVVLILWLYLSALAILAGGELNAELERQAAHRGEPEN